jgi:hypothetical protein
MTEKFCNHTDKDCSFRTTKTHCTRLSSCHYEDEYEQLEIPGIKDSGSRTEFDSGAVRDMHKGKGRYDLLPWEAIHELAKHCEEGAKKYGERNCEKDIPIHSLIDSAVRHLSCYLRGMRDEPHLRAAMWNIAFAIYMEQKHPEMQDIPQRK